MAILEIRQFGDPVLRQKSSEVAKIDNEITKLIKNMAETMYNAHGVGLAAVQVGILQKVIAVDVSSEGKDLTALINPVIISKEGAATEEEGCLSFFDYRVPVERAEYIKLRAIDLKSGEEIEFEATDWFARALQHELDHLDGKLIIDRTNAQERSRILKEITLGKKGD